jgi:hypothetical protein
MSKGALAENGVMGLPFPRVALARAFTGVIWRISSRVAAVLGLSHLGEAQNYSPRRESGGRIPLVVARHYRLLAIRIAIHGIATSWDGAGLTLSGRGVRESGRPVCHIC